ncbi:MAG: fibronectin type III domain-containing protein [Acidobacteriota bacterium]|nr:fibronectin type III domain-containing protein [Acidobacteriota bacterium]
MNTLHVKLATRAAVAGLLLSSSIVAKSPCTAQEIPTVTKAARVSITHGPELESADGNSAIIRWRSNNPGGADEHYGVVHFGTSPRDLSQTAKSHIRLNRNHSYTIFRVRVDGLAPRTTYYYTADSIEANGRGDGVKSALKQFTTPGPGERIATDDPKSAPRGRRS